MGVRGVLRRRDPFAAVRADDGVGGLPDVGDVAEEAVLLGMGELVEVADGSGLPVIAAGAQRVEVVLVPEVFGLDSNTIEVHLHGRRVGRLSAADADRYAPLVHDLLWRSCAAHAAGVILNDGTRTFLVLGLPRLDVEPGHGARRL
jgi:hypothetical protein